ncbi:MAG TPA: Crp/Fnr family transcriptional regulator [Terriglobales bacterium]|nr:Crp/Fnr family transcriptional regulator [Terriglobales bacterium]
MELIQRYDQPGSSPAACAVPHALINETQLDRRSARVQHLPLFSRISSVDRREIVSVAHDKFFLRPQRIFGQGDPEKQVVLLTSGAVKITQLGQDGTEVILRLSGPGELVGEAGLGSVRTHRSTAWTLGTAGAFVWDAAVFKMLLRRFPILHANVARMLGDHLRELEERFREISTESVSMRLSHELVRLANRVGERVNGAVRLSLSLEELAQLTGTTLFTVSRQLSRWRAEGIVSTGRRAVMVHDAQALAQFCERDSDSSQSR